MYRLRYHMPFRFYVDQATHQTFKGYVKQN